VEDDLIYALSRILSLEYLCFQTTSMLTIRIDCVHVVLLNVVFISALCMCNSCRIGGVVQSVGHGHPVC